MTHGTLRQTGQISRRYSRIAKAAAVKRNRRDPGERSHVLLDPSSKLFPFSKDLHEASTLDLELADLLGVSLIESLKQKRREEKNTCAQARPEVGDRDRSSRQKDDRSG